VLKPQTTTGTKIVANHKKFASLKKDEDPIIGTIILSQNSTSTFSHWEFKTIIRLLKWKQWKFSVLCAGFSFV